MKTNQKKRLQIALRRLYTTNIPNKQIMSLIGIDKNNFLIHIEKFTIDGMVKETFGKEWGFDHIVPVDLFNLDDEVDLKLAYNFINLIPMFNNDNRKKGASIHFSLIKLTNLLELIDKGDLDESIYSKNIIFQLIEKCNIENKNTYAKYIF